MDIKVRDLMHIIRVLFQKMSEEMGKRQHLTN